MSEKNNHPEWTNPYIVDADKLIIELIRNMKGIKPSPVDRSEEESSAGD